MIFLLSGGKSTNQAAAAARLGGDIIFGYKVGTDLFNYNAFAHHTKEGIELCLILKTQEARLEVALGTVNGKEENGSVVGSGANAYNVDKEKVNGVAETFVLSLSAAIKNRCVALLYTLYAMQH